MKSNTRVQALDALRGLAIFGMFLSGKVPQEFFPAWMYHTQVPPPKFEFNAAIPGISWVDLVFPFFIFSMGAAIPLAMSKKLEQGKQVWQLAVDVVLRGLLLGAFAIFVEHVRPWTMSESPTWGTWILSLLALLLSGGVFLRLPRAWKMPWKVAVRLGSIAIIYAIWGRWVYPAGHTGFDPAHNDIIILILANVWLMGGLVWLLTRRSILSRLVVLGSVVAFVLGSEVSGSWVASLWAFNIKSLFVPAWSVYFLTFIPGTIVGDILLRRSDEEAQEAWSKPHWISMGWLAFGAVAIVTALLFSRFGIPWLCVPLPLLVVLLSRKPSNSDEKRFTDIAQWSFGFLILGLAFEPMQGGIKKDPCTLSYVLVTAGLAGFMLCSWLSLQKLKPTNKLLSFTAGTGQNPMLAYIGTENLVTPLWALTLGWLFGLPAFASIMQGPWQGLAFGVTQTILLGVFMNLANRFRIVFRA